MNKKKYIVLVREVHVSHIEVEATSEADAMESVVEGTDAGQEVHCEYSHTLDPDTWTVEEVKG